MFLHPRKSRAKQATNLAKTSGIRPCIVFAATPSNVTCRSTCRMLLLLSGSTKVMNIMMAPAILKKRMGILAPHTTVTACFSMQICLPGLPLLPGLPQLPLPPILLPLPPLVRFCCSLHQCLLECAAKVFLKLTEMILLCLWQFRDNAAHKLCIPRHKTCSENCQTCQTKKEKCSQEFYIYIYLQFIYSYITYILIHDCIISGSYTIYIIKFLDDQLSTAWSSRSAPHW